MQRLPAPRRYRSSNVAPEPGAFSTAASKTGMLPRSAPEPRWLASLLAKMCGRPSERKRPPAKAAKNQSTEAPPKIAKKISQSKLAPPKAAKKSKEAPKRCKNLEGASSPLSDASSATASSTSSAPSVVSASSSSPRLAPPPASPYFRDHEENRDGRGYRERFNDYWYKVIVLGGTVIAFLYGELKSNLEKEVESKIKEKELKDKQDEIKRKDAEIHNLQTKLEEKKKGWFS